MGAYWAAVDEIRRQDLVRAVSADVVGQMFGMGFALAQFRRNLQDLAERVAERAAREEEDTEA